MLDRKSYEIQERPKMAINGNLSISTYFVLNKRDRTGKPVQRPFQAVLEEVKRQETEKAKMKQSSNLKRAASTNEPTIEENRSTTTATTTTTTPHPDSLVVPSIVKGKLDENQPNNSIVDPTIHNLLSKVETADSKTVLNRPMRSKACSII